MIATNPLFHSDEGLLQVYHKHASKVTKKISKLERASNRPDPASQAAHSQKTR